MQRGVQGCGKAVVGHREGGYQELQRRKNAVMVQRERQ